MHPPPLYATTQLTISPWGVAAIQALNVIYIPYDSENSEVIGV